MIRKITWLAIWASVAGYLVMWGVGMLPWGMALALELVLCVIWDLSSPDVRYTSRMSGNHCIQTKDAEDETVRIVDRARRSARQT